MSTIDIIDQLKLIKSRPSWQEYFMLMAYLSSCRSTCGVCNYKNNRILATGYNDFIEGAPHVGSVINGHEQLTIHAEINAVCHASKEGIALKGSTVYITHYSCINCTKSLIYAGINEIIYGEDYKNDDLVKLLCQTVGVKLFQFFPYK